MSLSLSREESGDLARSHRRKRGRRRQTDASAPPTPPKVANPAAAAAAAAATSAAGAAAVASGAPASIETLYGTLKSVRRGDHEDAEGAIYCALLGGWTRLVNESGTQGRGWRCEMMR